MTRLAEFIATHEVHYGGAVIPVRLVARDEGEAAALYTALEWRVDALLTDWELHPSRGLLVGGSVAVGAELRGGS